MLRFCKWRERRIPRGKRFRGTVGGLGVRLTEMRRESFGDATAGNCRRSSNGRAYWGESTTVER
ncbi:hypothetical protein RE6C_00818 [Rhodopirellula europaea 6C]|uniref:Uncharacterized protein n=1 Tax=Rhodopirellula europaea 6C TaxID=1263867 RepID=M2A8V8_9BACT|nr:hypothetical protein RE6C_00818 [Rhodopirellula europaea 6C]